MNMVCLNITSIELPDTTRLCKNYDIDSYFKGKQDRLIIYSNKFFDIPFNTDTILRRFIENTISELKNLIGESCYCYNITLCKLFPLCTNTVYYDMIPGNKNKNFLVTLTDKLSFKILESPLLPYHGIDLSTIKREQQEYLVYNYENHNKYYLLCNFVVAPYKTIDLSKYTCNNVKFDYLSSNILKEISYNVNNFTLSTAIFQNIHLFDRSPFKDYIEPFFKRANLNKYRLVNTEMVSIFDKTYIEIKKLLFHLTYLQSTNYSDLYIYILYIDPNDEKSYIKNKYDVYILHTGKEIFIEKKNYQDKELYINKVCFLRFFFLEQKPE